MQYIIFDLEATCWNGNQMGREQEIIEIGAVRIDAYGSVGDSFQRFVKPLANPLLSVYCKELTGISQTDIDAARYFNSVCKEFQSWIEISEDEYCLCSWGDKDAGLLEHDCLAFTMDTDWIEPCIDLKAQYHHIKRLPHKNGLKKTLRQEGIEFDGSHHRALDDAINLSALFVRYRDMWMF